MSIVGPLAPMSLPRGDSTTWNQPLDTVLRDLYVYYCRGGHASTTFHGRALEEMAVWLFSQLPGLQVRSTNRFSHDGSQEIDVIAYNSGVANVDEGFPMKNNTMLLLECKNWTKKADSSDVAWFDWKMKLGGVEHGVMISAQGITGDQKRRTFAAAIVAKALTEKRFIYIVTLSELEALSSIQDLRELLIDKRIGMTAGDPFS